MTKYGFAINLHRCVGCRTCTIACKMENSVPEGIQHMRVLNDQGDTVYDVPSGSYPALSFEWTPVPCMHCDSSPCLPVCPTGATSKRDDGIVLVDEEKCIGCRMCMEACPYDARSFDESSKTVVKCSLCAHRLDAGLSSTMCQLCCPNRAIVVGDLDDPDSAVSRTIRENETIRLLLEQETGPNVHYWRSVNQGL
ncbi:molybdopterin oxidoreductase [Berryella intestinalis]|uniref:Molybdopterin oxidoreductase n=1 Tax=Berryella intestinalis TaxID=1531429 RepID=A0A0A8B4J9_9ACTN|nr:4Fe-4S dicluster domain-containing protein [Berryella intestinalis]AJC12335.1 molybdopterin oxidoreductase [Berryella intestinalis]